MRSTSQTGRDARRAIRSGLVAVVLWAAAGRPARAGIEYDVIDLGGLGGSATEALAVNNQGLVVGRSKVDATGPWHAFAWTAGQGFDLSPSAREAAAYADDGMIVGYRVTSVLGQLFASSFATQDPHVPLPFPGIGSFAYGTNAAGAVVGSISDGSTQYAFLSAGGGARDLGSLGAGDSIAYDVNAGGLVVGTSAGRAFVWQDDGAGGRMTALGGDTRVAHAVNDAGQVVGAADSGAFLWQGGTPTHLGDGTAYAINAGGQAVGTSGGRAVLYRDGRAIDLNSLIAPGFGLGEARGINDAGWIVATSYPSGTTAARAFLLRPIPVPEPGSGLLVGLGGLGLGWAARRRR